MRVAPLPRQLQEPRPCLKAAIPPPLASQPPCTLSQPPTQPLRRPSRHTPRSSSTPAPAPRPSAHPSPPPPRSRKGSTIASRKRHSKFFAVRCPLLARFPPLLTRSYPDFHKNVGDRPNAQQKTELVKKVNSIPGGEHYTRDSVSRYFACKRRERGSAPQQPPKSATQSYRAFSFVRCIIALCSLCPSVVWPSLTEEKIERLRNLWAEKRHPNKKVIGIWAQSLGVEESHINAWLAYQSDEDEDDDNVSHSGHVGAFFSY